GPTARTPLPIATPRASKPRSLPTAPRTGPRGLPRAPRRAPAPPPAPLPAPPTARMSAMSLRPTPPHLQDVPPPVPRTTHEPSASPHRPPRDLLAAPPDSSR